MAATLLVLRDRVKALLNNDDFFTDTNLDIHINTSYHFHHAIVSDALQNRLVIEDFIDVVDGTRAYDLSTVKNSGRLPDQIVTAKYRGDGVSAVSYLDLKYETQTDNDDEFIRGTPEFYEIVGDDIVLKTIPNKTLTDGLKIRFVPYPVELVNDGDTVENSFDGLGEKCIAYYTVLLAKAQEETWDANSSSIQGFKASYEDLILRFKNNLEMRAFEEDEITAFDEEEQDA